MNDIKNTRLFDLVRYMRSELHEEDLITEDEYAWLGCGSPMALGHGSPSPRRLEDYAGLRKTIDKLIEERDTLKEVCAEKDKVIEEMKKEPNRVRPSEPIKSHDRYDELSDTLKLESYPDSELRHIVQGYMKGKYAKMDCLSKACDHLIKTRPLPQRCFIPTKMVQI